METLSRSTAAFERGRGNAMGGAIMLLQFQAGKTPGINRPNLALLAEPEYLASGDGSS